MRSFSWRKILYAITLVLFAAAIAFWILTLIGWLGIGPGFEPWNVFAAATISTISGFLSFLSSFFAPGNFAHCER